MKVLCVGLMLLAGLLSIASGQYVETIIPLPDSLSGIRIAEHFVYDSVDDRIYVADDGTEFVLVIDCATERKLTQIRVGGDVNVLGYNPINNKVYALRRSHVVVIDCATNTIVADVPVKAGLSGFCHNPANNRVYCVSRDTVTVLDGVTNTVTALLGFPWLIGSVECNPRDNRVYCAHPDMDSVSIVDGRNDSLLARVGVGHRPGPLCYNPASNCVYVGAQGEDMLSVIDGAGDSVLAAVPLPFRPGQLICSPRSNKVYCVATHWISESTLTVVDGTTNRVTDSVGAGNWAVVTYDPVRDLLFCLGGGALRVVNCSLDEAVLTRPEPDLWAPLCLSTRSSRFYCASENRLVVLDGATLDKTADFALGFYPGAVCADRSGELVFCASYESPGQIAVIRTSDNTVDTVLPVDRYPWKLFLNPQSDKVYVGYENGRVTVIDAARRHVVASFDVGGEAASFCLNPLRNLVYCTGGDAGIAVIDDSLSQVVARIPVGTTHPLAFNPLRNKLYAGTRDYCVAIIDAATNSEITRIEVGSRVTSLAYNPANDLIYVANRAGYVSVIDGAVDILLRQIIDIPAPYRLLLKPGGSHGYCLSVPGCPILSVIDCARDTPVAFISIAGGHSEQELAYDSLRNLIFISGDTAVTVIDAVSNRVIDLVLVRTYALGIVTCPGVGRTYVPDYDEGMLWVIRNAGAGGAGLISPRPPAALKVEPNPCRGVLTIRGAAEGVIFLSDIAGREVRRIPGASAVRMDLSGLPDGIYFVTAGTRGARAKVVLRQ